MRAKAKPKKTKRPPAKNGGYLYPYGLGPEPMLTPKMARDICKKLEIGNWFETACEISGVNKKSGRAWFDRGKRAFLANATDPRDKMYSEFYQQVCRASETFNGGAMEFFSKCNDPKILMQKFMMLNRRRTAKELEHRHKHEGKVEHEGTVGHVLIGGVKFELDELTIEQKRKILADNRRAKIEGEGTGDRVSETGGRDAGPLPLPIGLKELPDQPKGEESHDLPGS